MKDIRAHVALGVWIFSMSVGRDALARWPQDSDCGFFEHVKRSGQQAQLPLAPITIVPVYIGNASSAVLINSRSIYAALQYSNYYALLQNLYGAGSIGGTSPSNYVLTPHTLPASGVLLQADIEKELQWQINNGHLPTAVQQSIYAVHVAAPYGVAAGGSTPFCQSASGGYGMNHYGSSNYGQFTYTAMPDFSNPALNCSWRGLSWQQSQSFAESHELGEALTSPWKGSCGQIGDMCRFVNPIVIQDVLGNSWDVQAFWSNAAHGCVCTGPACGSPGADADVNGDGMSDIVLAGATGISYVPVLAGNAGWWNYRQYSVTDGNFLSWSALPHVRPVVGDFNADGYADVALTGDPGWTTVPVGLSQYAFQSEVFAVLNLGPYGGGSWPSSANFPVMAAATRFPPVAGDFDGDAHSDIAVAGAPYDALITVAYSNVNTQNVAGFSAASSSAQGNLSFATTIANWSANGSGQLLSGDFNNDGYSDLAYLGGISTSGATYQNIALALSTGNRDGSFLFVEAPVSGETSFPSWATTSLAVAGDFNGDGQTDIALAGGTGWNTMPIAYSHLRTTGGFAALNIHDYGGSFSFSTYAATSPLQLLAGDWFGLGYADIAMTGVNGWASVPYAQAPIVGPSFFFWTAENPGAPAFGPLAQQSTARAASASQTRR